MNVQQHLAEAGCDAETGACIHFRRATLHELRLAAARQGLITALPSRSSACNLA